LHINQKEYDEAEEDECPTEEGEEGGAKKAEKG